MARALVASAIVLVVLAAAAASFTGLYGLWLAVPIPLAVAIVAACHTRPLTAALVGAGVTYGVIVGVVFPQLLIKAIQGDFDNTDYCDGLCFTNGEGFGIATIIMLFIAIPPAIAGGIISLITSVIASFTARSARA